MKHLRQSLLSTALFGALLMSSMSHAQNTQWQVQIGNQAEPRQGVTQVPNTPVAVQTAQMAAPTVESIQAQQEARIRWAVQRGFLAEPEYRRLLQIQANIEHNRRLAYADGYFNIQEQQYIFGQLNMLSAEIDTLMLNSNFVLAYYQQFNTPIAVWTVNSGWVNGRYVLRADEHHNRAYRAPAQPPAAVAPPVQQGQPQPQEHHRRNRLRDVLDPLGVFR